MTKRKAKPAPEIQAGPPVVAEDLAGPLEICPTCDGFGGVAQEEVWKVCWRCDGDGRIRKAVQP
jgi:hypothetical protein